jgi:hypothetical protein
MFGHGRLRHPFAHAWVTIGLLLCVSGCPQPSSSVITTDYGAFVQRVILAEGSGLGQDFTQPAYIRFGPDGKLYATNYEGSLFAITLNANHDVVDVQEYQPLGYRCLTGLAFDPWASPADPVLYVINNDAWIYSKTTLRTGSRASPAPDSGRRPT